MFNECSIKSKKYCWSDYLLCVCTLIQISTYYYQIGSDLWRDCNFHLNDWLQFKFKAFEKWKNLVMCLVLVKIHIWLYFRTFVGRIWSEDLFTWREHELSINHIDRFYWYLFLFQTEEILSNLIFEAGFGFQRCNIKFFFDNDRSLFSNAWAIRLAEYSCDLNKRVDVIELVLKDDIKMMKVLFHTIGLHLHIYSPKSWIDKRCHVMLARTTKSSSI